jgi:hypothetical protein
MPKDGPTANTNSTTTNTNATAQNKALQEHPAFAGFLVPAHLNADGTLQNEDVEAGRPHFFVCVYPFDSKQETAGANVHAKADSKLGQPFFCAYIYPNPFLEDPKLSFNDALGGGGPGGIAEIGGSGLVPGSLIYTGTFRTVLPVAQPTPASGSGSSGSSSGTTSSTDKSLGSSGGVTSPPAGPAQA